MKKKKRHTYASTLKPKGSEPLSKVVSNPKCASAAELTESLSATDIQTILTVVFGPDWRYPAAWAHPRQALRPSEVILREPAIQEFLLLREFVTTDATAGTLFKMWAIKRGNRPLAEAVEDTPSAVEMPPWWTVLKRHAEAGTLSEACQVNRGIDLDAFKKNVAAGLAEIAPEELIAKGDEAARACQPSWHPTDAITSNAIRKFLKERRGAREPGPFNAADQAPIT